MRKYPARVKYKNKHDLLALARAGSDEALADKATFTCNDTSCSDMPCGRMPGAGSNRGCITCILSRHIQPADRRLLILALEVSHDDAT